MEPEANCSWCSASNWVVSGGDLEGAISFESSCFPSERSAGVRSRPVLVLQPPPSGTEPCEITVSFENKHELCKVNVRSTARIYEMYTTSDSQSEKEYLCTVRCGPTEVKALNNGPDQQKGMPDCNNSSNSASSEDDGWVEVKDVEFSSPRADIGRVILNKLEEKAERVEEEFYEALAEIEDVCPCTLLTLRLLSLGSKGTVHIEEVFIYAKPVESIDLAPHYYAAEHSNVSSLLSMFVSSLMEFPKIGSLKYENASESRVKGSCRHSLFPECKHVGPQVGDTVERARDHSFLPTQVQGKPTSGCPSLVSHEKDASLSNIERLLNQLDSRLRGIEAFCSRFEESILKLMNRTEARFQHLEEQVDALGKRKCQTLTSLSSQILAPEFPCEESQSDAQKEGLEDNYQDVRTSLCADNLLDAMHISPGLMVTAPEFTADDEDKIGDVLLQSCGGNSSTKKQISSLIDGALASALSALLASTSGQSNEPHSIAEMGTLGFPTVGTNDDDQSGLTSAGISSAGAEQSSFSHCTARSKSGKIVVPSAAVCLSSEDGEKALQGLKIILKAGDKLCSGIDGHMTSGLPSAEVSSEGDAESHISHLQDESNKEEVWASCYAISPVLKTESPTSRFSSLQNCNQVLAVVDTPYCLSSNSADGEQPQLPSTCTSYERIEDSISYWNGEPDNKEDCRSVTRISLEPDEEGSPIIYSSNETLEDPSGFSCIMSLFSKGSDKYKQPGLPFASISSEEAEESFNSCCHGPSKNEKQYVASSEISFLHQQERPSFTFLSDSPCVVGPTLVELPDLLSSVMGVHEQSQLTSSGFSFKGAEMSTFCGGPDIIERGVSTHISFPHDCTVGSEAAESPPNLLIFGDSVSPETDVHEHSEFSHSVVSSAQAEELLGSCWNGISVCQDALFPSTEAAESQHGFEDLLTPGYDDNEQSWSPSTGISCGGTERSLFTHSYDRPDKGEYCDSNSGISSPSVNKYPAGSWLSHKLGSVMGLEASVIERRY